VAAEGLSVTMSAEIFDLKAEILWQTLPARVRSGLLNNVWCGHCRTSVSLVDYTGKAVGGDLVLTGRCGVCGGRVARHVEIFEARSPEN